MRWLLTVALLGTCCLSTSSQDQCQVARSAPGPGCAPSDSKDKVLCVPVWPPGSEGGHQVDVTVLLPDNFYSNNQKRCIPETETRLQASYRRVGPAILAGFEEAARRGWLRGISFNIEFRDSQCDNTFAPKVKIAHCLLTD